MAYEKQTISLGFTPQLFPRGVHICQIFTSDDEREDSLLKFVASGLASKERTGCFSSRINEQKIGMFLRLCGLSLEQARDAGSLILSGVHEMYFKDNRFDPDEMLGLLSRLYQESLEMGYRAVRVIGEMEPEVQHLPGGSRLLEYEAKVSLLQKQYPFTAVCQYDAREFDGATIMDVLKVHPLMAVRGSVVHNPFYIKPEVFLQQHE